MNYLKECRMLGLIDRKWGSSILCSNRDFENIDNPINKEKSLVVDICFDNNSHKGEPLYVIIIGEDSDFKEKVKSTLWK